MLSFVTSELDLPKSFLAEAMSPEVLQISMAMILLENLARVLLLFSRSIGLAFLAFCRGKKSKMEVI